tara:strand:- start:366 stop:803 length:438 start_codon:yes stop_codon:yes gene_type:complete
MNEIQAIIGISQLKRLESFVEHRNIIATKYIKVLGNLEKEDRIAFQQFPDNIKHPYWKFMVILKNVDISREKIKFGLNKFGISIDWPYEPLMHLQPVFNQLPRSSKSNLKKSEVISKNHLFLPIHLGILDEDAIYIAHKFAEFIK